MARLMVIYTTPKDAAAFDAYYLETHVPLVHKIPGLKKFEVTQGPVSSPGGESGVHKIAMLYFDDVPSMLAGLGSDEGKAAAADAQGFMSPGDRRLIFETHEP